MYRRARAGKRTSVGESGRAADKVGVPLTATVRRDVGNGERDSCDELGRRGGIGDWRASGVCIVRVHASGARVASDHRWVRSGSNWAKRGSPYNHPPSRKAATQCLSHERDGAKRDGAEGQRSDVTQGGWLSW